jgi:hypothetical protein
MDMKYPELVEALFINMEAGSVPMVIGDAGIGKSQLPKSVAERFQLEDGVETEIVTLFGSLLKEGELGGIPVPREDVEYVIKETGNITSKENVAKVGNKLYTVDTNQLVVRKKEMVNDYTTHVKLKRVIENGKKDNFITILFIDELNRCENAVQQELMQLILENQINQTVLPRNCRIMAAGNPDSSEFADYQVVVMNEALKDRFFQYSLKSDVNSWLQWAMNVKEDPIKGTHEIDSDVINFIAEYPEQLHNIKTTDDIKPTPRGWAMFSESYKMAKKYFSADVEDKTISIGIAKLGETAAMSFVKFIREKENPLIKPAEIFESDGALDLLDSEYCNVISRLRVEKITRQHVIINRCIKYINENFSKFEADYKEKKKKDYKSCKAYRFVEAIAVLPKDIVLGVLQDLSKNYDHISKFMTNFEEYMDLFFDTNMRVNQANLK